jgi:transcriptional regulator with XRE-family HTH domain
MAGEPACAPCVAAKSRYEKARHVYGPRMVPAIGTRRRIQALKAMGHSGADIAARLGVTGQAVHKLEHGTAERIFAATALNVARVFEEMCMTLPTGYHRTRIRNAAAAAGYAPPLAWTNIDDPDEVPRDWQRAKDDWIAELYDLDEQHVGVSEACARLGVSRKSLQKRCERHDLTPLYSRLVDREQGRYWRNGVAEGGVA